MAVLTRERLPTRVFLVEETPGARIARRRKALGLDVIDLAQQSGVDRGQLARIEAGAVKRPRQSTLYALESALDRLEAEMSGPYDAPDEAEAGLITFRVHGNFGVDVVVQGPVANAEEVERAVERLIKNMQRGESSPPGTANCM